MSSAPSPANLGTGGSRPAEARPPATIRAGRLSDVDDLVALEGRCFPPEDQFPRAAIRRLLRDSVPAGRAVVLVIEGAGLAAAIIGLVRRTSQVARIYSIAVDPACRGQGLAGQLLRALARRLQARGCTALSLEVRAENAPARALYDKLGFVVTATLPRYYGGRHPGVRMRAPLARLLRA